MPRVTSPEVKLVFPSDRDLNPFITTASLLVDEELVGTNQSSTRLKQIELYLAAHFAALTEEGAALTSTRTGKSEDEYAPGIFGESLRSTRFGQLAISLDTSGRLAMLSSTKGKAVFRVV